MNEPIKSRREREKQARYDAILDAAEATFAEKGYERTSMDDIARRASLSRALLYVYFRDKSAIQRGIVLRAGESLRGRFERARNSASDSLQQLVAIGRAYYRFCLEEPEYFGALTQAATTMSEADDAQTEQLHCSETAVMTIMVEIIEQGLAAGILSRSRIRDPLQTALFLRGALHGVIMGCRQDMGRSGVYASFPRDELIEYTLSMLITSVAAEQPPGQ